jgi:NADH dehydrogenase (ubiquinone) 1 alpha subcomplex subunit 2
MKKHNPQIPIMLREAAGTAPRVYARYGPSENPPPDTQHESNTFTDLGVEKSQSLEGLTDKQIEDTVTGLVKTA